MATFSQEKTNLQLKQQAWTAWPLFQNSKLYVKLFIKPAKGGKGPNRVFWPTIGHQEEAKTELFPNRRHGDLQVLGIAHLIVELSWVEEVVTWALKVSLPDSFVVARTVIAIAELLIWTRLLQASLALNYGTLYLLINDFLKFHW